MTIGISIYLFLELILMQGYNSKHEYCEEAVKSVNPVASCPTSKEEWDKAATKKKCTEIAKQQRCTSYDKFIYHCVIDEYNSDLVEVCAPQRIILGHCAEFNVGGGVIQDKFSAPCNTTFPKCHSFYNSSDAYKYTDCYKLVKGRKTTSSTTAITNDMTTSKSEDGIKSVIIGVGIFVVVFFVLIIIMAIYLKKRRNKINKTTKSRKEECKLIADKPQGMECPMSTFGSRGKELFRRSISV